MQKYLLIVTATIASLHFAPGPFQGRADRLAALETKVEKLESTVMAQGYLAVLSRVSVLDRMDRLFTERTAQREAKAKGRVESPEVEALRGQVRDVIREGLRITRGIQRLVEGQRISLAMRNHHAAVQLRSDVYHRIRILREATIDDGPQAKERRRRRDAEIQRLIEYRKKTPDPEKVKQHLEKSASSTQRAKIP